MHAFLRQIYLAVTLCVVLVYGTTINKDLIVKNVERNIDIASQLVKINTKITLENTGKSPVNHFLFAVESPAEKKLAYIGATKSVADDESRKQLPITPVQIKEHKDAAFWEIKLSQALEAGRSTSVDVETVFTHLLVPNPSQITQGEKQLVLYVGNLYFYSPYPVTSQKTNVVTTTANIESFTKTKPFTNSESTISYGPYEKIAPLSHSDLRVHYENNNPFLVINKLERLIEVSHWGNIAVEEVVQISHNGAKLKGSFSRYEYQREQSGISSIRSFKTILPAAASDVYYRDEIGNISTSHLRVLEDSVELDIRPRFPLFGGWKTQYTLGYNLPSYEYLYNRGDDFILKMRFLDHVYDDMIVEELIVRIILPEGSKELNLQVPYEVKRSKDGVVYTYLDTVGRPVVVAHKDNLAENHIQEFELHYKFQKLLMLQEPLLVVLAFYLLFFLVIIYVRLDFAISKDELSESKMRVASHCDNVRQLQDKLTDTYHTLDTAIATLKSSKDVNTFQNTNKKIQAEQKATLQSLSDLVNKIKPEAADTADRVNDLVKISRQIRDAYAQHVGFCEKLVQGKMKKEQYMELQQSFIKQKDEFEDKINNIVKIL
ncbi:hypothetical protein CHUAL_007080 [Chamberlinius hualienensis]